MIRHNGRPVLRILLIEDSPDDELLVVRELEKAGYRVICKRVQTEAALQFALEGEAWDVIICDYVLPSFSADQALAIAQHSARHLPFLVVSGSVDEDTVMAMLRAGADDFISKDKLNRLPFAVQRDLRIAARGMEARLELERSYEATIEAWGKALEFRDHFTAGHTQRVTDMTMRLARRMDVSRDDLPNIHRGALLHDVGKMGIPDAVLLKPGYLSRDEEKIMQMHPQLAYDMLSPIPFLRAAINIPYCHHETWDGSGYPRGLAGKEIPFEARIFSVVDVYDALVSDRPYRKSWRQENAINYIQEQSGIRFDPAVVAGFVAMVEPDEHE
ncbi:MAG TPA: HD domain-containing phosphohydrolase [Anaerolineales bacterium]|nr:HD domain-containing phosphohydrolase [Anaerolineales bacterium]